MEYHKLWMKYAEGPTGQQYRGSFVLGCSLVIMFLYLECTAFDNTPSLFFKIIAAIADSSIVFLILSLLKGKWRILQGLCSLIIMVIILANMLYIRTFNDLIPSSAYFNSRVDDPTVTSGALHALRVSDIVLALAGFAPIIYYFAEGRKYVIAWKSQKRILQWGFVVCLVSWSISLAGTYRRLAIYKGYFSFNEISRDLVSSDKMNWRSVYAALNFTGYSLHCLADMTKSSYVILSDTQKKEIVDLLKEKNRVNGNVPKLNDSIPENLIMIIVESLESRALSKTPAIYPVLTSLIQQSNTIYIEKCRIQADYGRSSDAQFILNTGLLPLRHEALVNRYADNDYPSLAKAIEGHSVEIIAEDRSLWSHGMTSRSYGFDTLVDNVAPTGSDRDKLLFREAEYRLASIQQPFFMLITTISMHDPYTEPAVKHTLPDSIVREFADIRDREYFERLHFFDNCLGKFISYLKNVKLYDNTLIVITGDHEVRGGTLSATDTDLYVPLIILNSPNLSFRKDFVAQTDIFPTLLYLLNKKGELKNHEYSGIGNNIFRKDSVSYSTEIDYKISELIIRGR